LPIQIRRLRERHGWTQAELAEKAGTQQVVVSRWENPDNKGITLNTLKRLARAFDVALIVRFAPFSEFIDWVCTLSPHSFQPASFEEESLDRRYEGSEGAIAQRTSSSYFDPYLTASPIIFLENFRNKSAAEGFSQIQTELAMSKGEAQNAAS
jgi:transcriptional regulator with XRE-family HTH domain